MTPADAVLLPAAVPLLPADRHQLRYRDCSRRGSWSRADRPGRPGP
ncbi:hypothetical protein [Streptomyces sp. NPDC059979]